LTPPPRDAIMAVDRQGSRSEHANRKEPPVCMCDRPTVNGYPGYRSTYGAPPTVHQPDPPTIRDSDELVYDAPGRCGRGGDSHSHHFRLVRRGGSLFLLVRHGGGNEEIRVPSDVSTCLEECSPEARYWLMRAMYSTARRSASEAREREADRWRQAAAEKRIRTRKVRGQNIYRVRIDPPKDVASPAA